MYYLIAPLHKGKLQTPEDYNLLGYGELNEIYQISDRIPEGYGDISSIINWFEIGMKLDRDFLFIKDRISKIVAQKGLHTAIATVNDLAEIEPKEGDIYLIENDSTTEELAKYRGMLAIYTEDESYKFQLPSAVGYDTLNDIEREICLSCKIGDIPTLYRQFGRVKVKEKNVEYHEKAIAARNKRMLKAEIEVYHELPGNAFEVTRDLASFPGGDLTYLYERKGIIGSTVDYHPYFNPNPPPGVLDYTSSTGFYEGKGLLQKDWNTASGITLEQLNDNLFQILAIG